MNCPKFFINPRWLLHGWPHPSVIPSELVTGWLCQDLRPLRSSSHNVSPRLHDEPHALSPMYAQHWLHDPMTMCSSFVWRRGEEATPLAIVARLKNIRAVGIPKQPQHICNPRAWRETGVCASTLPYLRIRAYMGNVYYQALGEARLSVLLAGNGEPTEFAIPDLVRIGERCARPHKDHSPWFHVYGRPRSASSVVCDDMPYQTGTPQTTRSASAMHRRMYPIAGAYSARILDPRNCRATT